MSPMGVFYILIGMGIVWTGVWIFLIRSVPEVEPEESVDEKTKTLREQLIFPIGVIFLVGLAISIYWMPYPVSRARTIGEPQAIVDVTGMQWGWVFRQDGTQVKDLQVPVNTSVEFAVSSLDVNHNFAIYNDDDELVTQVQAMPGYTNRLIWEFDKPGTYTVRCLEYCGIFHHMMIATFTVV